jgi:hypothetical protein
MRVALAIRREMDSGSLKEMLYIDIEARAPAGKRTGRD